MTGVCVSLLASSTAELLHDLPRAEELGDLVEIRGDHGVGLDLAAIRRAARRPLVYTARARSEGGALEDHDPRRHRLLAEADRQGFDYIDLELSSGFADLMDARRGRGLIVSHHDLGGTPEDLDDLYRRMCAAGADIVKIVTSPRGIDEVGQLLAFAARTHRSGPRPLVALAMGTLGQPTRVLAARSGAPFTYASLRAGGEAAPGQIPAADLRSTYRIDNVSPSTRVFGVLGSDVTRSLSPSMLNAAFAEAGLDAVYVPFSADDVAGFVRTAGALGVEGFSVTRPFKQAILPFLSSVDETAAAAGSVNTVKKTPDGLVGSSTDGRGVVEPLSRRIGLRGAHISILGAGGAARAAAAALKTAGAAVVLHARDDTSAAKTARELGVASASWSQRGESSWVALINATPLGSHEALDQTPVPRERLRRGAVVFDMVYSPAQTRLLREARATGCVTIDGIEMLVAQAVAQFLTWTGLEAPVEVMERAARRATEAVS